MADDIARIAKGPWNRNQTKALTMPNMDGIVYLGDSGIDRFVKLGFLTEFDIPTLGGFADAEVVIEMRRLGITLVAHTWTKLGLAVRDYIKEQADGTD